MRFWHRQSTWIAMSVILPLGYAVLIAAAGHPFGVLVAPFICVACWARAEIVE